MASASNLITGLMAFALSIYVTMEYVDTLTSRCCYSMRPSLRPEAGTEKLIWSRGLASLATNPRELWRVSIIKAAKEVQAITKVELVVSGDLMKSLSLRTKLSIIIRLVHKLGIKKGLRSYFLFNKVLRSYPNSMNEALIALKEVNQLIKVIKDVRN